MMAESLLWSLNETLLGLFVMSELVHVYYGAKPSLWIIKFVCKTSKITICLHNLQNYYLQPLTA